LNWAKFSIGLHLENYEYSQKNIPESVEGEVYLKGEGTASIANSGIILLKDYVSKIPEHMS
jgi:hypothetical protein